MSFDVLVMAQVVYSTISVFVSELFLSHIYRLSRRRPILIKTVLNWYTPPRDLRSRNIPSLIPVKSRSIIINNRLLQGGSAKQWNSLPKSIKCAGSLTIFKKTAENISLHAAMTLLIDYIQW